MSGLFARGELAGRDGVRYARSKHMGDIGGASVIFGSSRVSTDRSSIYCVLQVRELSAEHPRSSVLVLDHVGMAVGGRL
jgi:hypothetical protein